MFEAVLEAANFLESANSNRSAVDVQVKSDHTLVTNLDIESQRRIIQRLQGMYPIVAEEDPQSHSIISSASTYLLVDPLDGTTSCKRFLGQQGGHVGFGPLVGFVSDYRLTAAAYYSVPHRKLFTAVRGEGAHMTLLDGSMKAAGETQTLRVSPCPDLSKAGMLFFISRFGEAGIVERLRLNHAVENVYRFGGFANDSTRIAQDFEQIQLQFYAKPWDFPAVLFAAEAGCDVFCDPMTRRVPLQEWIMEDNNPVVVLPAGTRDAFFSLVDAK
jgi:fructose-1,6-bisphosphatase/inositol monophosphatase family enzyme